jgi:hypothetical protein
MTANRHVAGTYIAEATRLERPGCRAIWHLGAELCKQIPYFRRGPPWNDLAEREVLAVAVSIVAATTGPIPASPKSKGAEYRLNAFGANVFDLLRSPTIHTRPSAQGIGVRLATNDLDLDSAEQLLTFFESQANLLRGHVGDRTRNCANVVRNWRVSIGRQLKADSPFHWGSLPVPIGYVSYPLGAPLRFTPSNYESSHQELMMSTHEMEQAGEDPDLFIARTIDFIMQLFYRRW